MSRFCQSCNYFLPDAPAGVERLATTNKQEPVCTRTERVVDFVWGTKRMNTCHEERTLQATDRCGRIGKHYIPKQDELPLPTPDPVPTPPDETPVVYVVVSGPDLYGVQVRVFKRFDNALTYAEHIEEIRDVDTSLLDCQVREVDDL